MTWKLFLNQVINLQIDDLIGQSYSKLQQRFQLWAYKVLVKWAPGVLHVDGDVNVSVHMDLPSLRTQVEILYRPTV